MAVTQEEAAKTTGGPGPWEPLKRNLFRMIWIASVLSNIGSWMHEVGAGWLMTNLAPTPAMVSLVQAATSAPLFLLALPAGALADIVDRRRYLIVAQLWMMFCAAVLSALTLFDLVNASSLLILTFGLGIGVAMMMPAWGAIIPELVPKDELQPAIALNTLAINMARAVGPALAGLIIAFAGIGTVFFLNALSFLAVIYALKKWQRIPQISHLPAEQLHGALRSGVRYARHSAELRAVLIHGCAFFIFASASWALLPLIVRQELQSGPGIFGLMLGCIGLGAMGGAFLLPRLSLKFSRDAIIASATVVYALAMLSLAYSTRVVSAAIAMLFIGLSWMTVVSSLMMAAQTALPSWVRARGLAFFWIVYTGGMALGSVLWGQVASFIDITLTLTCASIGAIVGIVLAWHYRVGYHEIADHSPPLEWTTPPASHKAHKMDRGPIMVTIEYQIDLQNEDAFIEVMHSVRHMRQRNGAYMWELFADINRPGYMIEMFMVESLVEHLRQRERMTQSDHHARNMARMFHIGEGPPKVTHLLAAERRQDLP